MAYLDLAFGIAATLTAAVSPAQATRAGAPAAGPFSVVPEPGSATLVTWPKGKGQAQGQGRGLAGPARLIWTGFQTSGGQSRVFVQTTAEVDLDVHNVVSALVVTLHRCRIHMRNNSRMLDTRFFPTPVAQISARQRGRDVRLDVRLKGPAWSKPRRLPGPDGTQFWVIDVAPLDRAAPPAAAPVTAN